VSTAKLLFAWLLAHPSNLFPITGTTKTERIQEAASALEVVLDKQDWFAMLKIIKGFDVA
jgi:predicted oxidoreductase